MVEVTPGDADAGGRARQRPRPVGSQRLRLMEWGVRAQCFHGQLRERLLNLTAAKLEERGFGTRGMALPVHRNDPQHQYLERHEVDLRFGDAVAEARNLNQGAAAAGGSPRGDRLQFPQCALAQSQRGIRYALMTEQ